MNERINNFANSLGPDIPEGITGETIGKSSIVFDVEVIQEAWNRGVDLELLKIVRRELFKEPQSLETDESDKIPSSLQK